MLASFLLAGSETSVANNVRSQLDVTKRNYFGVFSDMSGNEQKLQIQRARSSVYRAPNIHVQRR